MCVCVCVCPDFNKLSSEIFVVVVVQLCSPHFPPPLSPAPPPIALTWTTVWELTVGARVAWVGVGKGGKIGTTVIEQQ